MWRRRRAEDHHLTRPAEHRGCRRHALESRRGKRSLLEDEEEEEEEEGEEEEAASSRILEMVCRYIRRFSSRRLGIRCFTRVSGILVRMPSTKPSRK